MAPVRVTGVFFQPDDAGPEPVGFQQSLCLLASRAAGEHREVASREAVNEIPDRSGFEDGICESPDIVHTEVFMQGGGIEVSLDYAHRQACLLGQV